jgi:hypothetical protein
VRMNEVAYQPTWSSAAWPRTVEPRAERVSNLQSRSASNTATREAASTTQPGARAQEGYLSVRIYSAAWRETLTAEEISQNHREIIGTGRQQGDYAITPNNESQTRHVVQTDRQSTRARSQQMQSQQKKWHEMQAKPAKINQGGERAYWWAGTVPSGSSSSRSSWRTRSSTKPVD